jgi:hypothetical protein
MSNSPSDPVLLELAPLGREQIGPFLLLGVDKQADQAAVERSWADRLKLARWNQIDVSLADINWARAILSDPEKRIRAEAATLNLDTADAVLRRLEEQFGCDGPMGARCKPLDVERDLTDYSPAVEIPDTATYRASIVAGEIPEEVPAARKILEECLREPLDPWDLPVRW